MGVESGGVCRNVDGSVGRGGDEGRRREVRGWENADGKSEVVENDNLPDACFPIVSQMTQLDAPESASTLGGNFSHFHQPELGEQSLRPTRLKLTLGHEADPSGVICSQ